MVDRALTEVRQSAQETKLPTDGASSTSRGCSSTSCVRSRASFPAVQNWKVVWTAEQGGLDVADASTKKVFGTEHYLDAIRLLMEVVGAPAYVKKGSPGAVLGTRLGSSTARS
jgi:hypothetical protein